MTLTVGMTGTIDVGGSSCLYKSNTPSANRFHGKTGAKNMVDGMNTMAIGVGSGNFRVADNLAVTPADNSPFCITAPVDARLPGGGGYQVCGLYDVAPAKFGRVDNLVTTASQFYGPKSSANWAPLFPLR